MTKVTLSLCTWAAAYVRWPKPAYASTFLRTQLGFQKYKKCKFSTIMVEVWNEFHIVWEPLQNPFFHYIKPYMVYIQNIQESQEKNLRLSRK